MDEWLPFRKAVKWGTISFLGLCVLFNFGIAVIGFVLLGTAGLLNGFGEAREIDEG